MDKVVGFLIERDGRKLFLDDLPEWVSLDENYTATALVKWNDSLEMLLAEVKQDLELYMSICELQEEEILSLKGKLKELER
jgi:hypothetical protein